MQPSPIEFTAGPATETPGDDDESEDDDNDDEDEEDVIAEAGEGNDDDVVTEKPLRGVTVDELPAQKVSRFDSRQKRSGFIDVWWLFDDGGA